MSWGGRLHWRRDWKWGGGPRLWVTSASAGVGGTFGGGQPHLAWLCASPAHSMTSAKCWRRHGHRGVPTLQALLPFSPTKGGPDN